MKAKMRFSPLRRQRSSPVALMLGFKCWRVTHQVLQWITFDLWRWGSWDQSGPLHLLYREMHTFLALKGERQDAWNKRQKTKGWRTFRSQALRPPVGFSFRKVSRVFEDTRPFCDTSRSFGFVRVLEDSDVSWNKSSPRMWKDIEVSGKLIGVREFLLLWVFSFFFFSLLHHSASPMALENT